MKAKLGGRTWAALLTFGLVGQIAWVIENMYFNVFLYNTISGDTSMIAAMVAWSAVTATVTTLVMGALSDRLGRRKAFIVAGYLLWGVSIGAFALIKSSPVAAAAHSAAVLVVVLDCVMTFFGSTANDAAFNAWVTDVTVPENRGRVETVLAIMPLVAMLVVFGALDGLTQAGSWRLFFLIVGGVTELGGGMVISACCNGLIRDYTPAGKAGLFQGIRIVFQVLLPMVTGPYIGAAVIRGTGMTYEDLGTVKQVPTAEIFLAAAAALVLLAIPAALLKRKEAAK